MKLNLLLYVYPQSGLTFPSAWLFLSFSGTHVHVSILTNNTIYLPDRLNVTCAPRDHPLRYGSLYVSPCYINRIRVLCRLTIKRNLNNCAVHWGSYEINESWTFSHTDFSRFIVPYKQRNINLKKKIKIFLSWRNYTSLRTVNNDEEAKTEFFILQELDGVSF